MESVIKSKEYLINTCCHKILEYLYSQTRLVIRSSTIGTLEMPNENKKLISDSYLIVPTDKFEHIIGSTPVIFQLALKKLKSNNHIDVLTSNGKIDRISLLDNENIEESGKAAYEIEFYLDLNNKKEIEEKVRKYTSLRSWIAIGISILALFIAVFQLLRTNK